MAGNKQHIALGQTPNRFPIGVCAPCMMHFGAQHASGDIEATVFKRDQEGKEGPGCIFTQIVLDGEVQTIHVHSVLQVRYAHLCLSRSTCAQLRSSTKEFKRGGRQGSCDKALQLYLQLAVRTDHWQGTTQTIEAPDSIADVHGGQDRVQGFDYAQPSTAQHVQRAREVGQDVGRQSDELRARKAHAIGLCDESTQAHVVRVHQHKRMRPAGQGAKHQQSRCILRQTHRR